MKKTRHSPRVVLFDLDGTLAQSMEMGLDTANLIAPLFGYKRLNAEDDRLRKLSGKEFVKEVLGLGQLGGTLWMLTIKLLAPLNAAKVPLFDGVRPLIAQVRKKYRVGVLSSAPSFYVQKILRRGGIPKLDWEIAGISYFGKPQALRKFMRANGYLPEEIIYIGDEVRDFAACAEVGIPFIAVSWGKDHPELFAKAGVKNIAEKTGDIARMVS